MARLPSTPRPQLAVPIPATVSVRGEPVINRPPASRVVAMPMRGEVNERPVKLRAANERAALFKPPTGATPNGRAAMFPRPEGATPNGRTPTLVPPKADTPNERTPPLVPPKPAGPKERAPPKPEPPPRPAKPTPPPGAAKPPCPPKPPLCPPKPPPPCPPPPPPPPPPRPAASNVRGGTMRSSVAAMQRLARNTALRAMRHRARHAAAHDRRATNADTGFFLRSACYATTITPDGPAPRASNTLGKRGAPCPAMWSAPLGPDSLRFSDLTG